MLSMLSGHPRAYSTLIPSKDHRDAYLEILAWLMKGGWVTQLRVFGWIRVRREIQRRSASRPFKNGVDDHHRDDDDDNEDDNDDAIILLDPHKANAQQSQWLDYIGSSFSSSPSFFSTSSAPAAPTKDDNDRDPDDDELLRTTAWPHLTRYFNGRLALEQIPLREDALKRKTVWRFLSAMEARGDLVCVRHW